MYEFLAEDMTYEELNQFQKNKANWLEETNRYSLNTKKSYWIFLNRYVNSFEIKNELDLMYFNKEEIISVLDSVTGNNLHTIAGIYSVINSYINQMVRYNDITNPCDEIDIGKILVRKTKGINTRHETLQDFYNLVLDLNCSDVDKMILVLLRYGVDINDIGFIKWEDIDKENKILNIKNRNLQFPIDNIFLIMLDKAKECNLFMSGQKRVVYIDYGYVIKATATVKWKVISGNACHNKIGELSRRNNIKKLSVCELNKCRRHDLLLKKHYDKNTVTINDLKDVISIFEETITPSKVDSLKKNFELVTRIKVDTKRR